MMGTGDFGDDPSGHRKEEEGGVGGGGREEDKTHRKRGNVVEQRESRIVKNRK